MLEEKLSQVAVIGAAGKMGHGIALILLQQMALLDAKQTGGGFRLTLIDPNEEALQNTRPYFRAQLTRFAEKNINQLRECFRNNPKLVSNEEIVHHFVQGAMDITRWHNEPFQLKDTKLVFEAIVEDLQAKTNLFQELRETCPRDTLFLTNTSSVPIHILAKNSGIEGRLIGFHFYNPPAVQKLVEIVNPNEALIPFSEDLAKQLGKLTVHSKDIPGFIGNGHFIREVAYACQLAEQHPIALIDQVTKQLLLRPMGIFQLIDYVGIDVCARIAKIMREHIPEPNLKVSLLEQMVEKGIIGGQNMDGSQKEGFFQYEDHHPIYESLLPPQKYSWRDLHRDPNAEAKIKQHFQALWKQDTVESTMAQQFLSHSQAIIHILVDTKVAKSVDDVAMVLKNGFYHLYSPTEIKL